jgi:dihydrodipicolinate synthase/N-acetylneuraminate lyase
MIVHGIIPPMITPFTANGDIALNTIAAQVDWLIGAGVRGVGYVLDGGE